MDTLPIYKLVLNGDTEGVDFVALVDDPAIERNFVAFKSQKPLSFKTTDSDQHILAGPLMVADMLIFRNDPQHGEHLVLFDAPTISQIVQKFFKEGNTDKVNLMHNDAEQPKGIYMFESAIINKEGGFATPAGFEELPDGSWFGSFKVDNAEIWDKFIKTGEFKGFSVEGFFSYENTDTHTTPDETEDIINELKEMLAEVGLEIEIL